jgi:hypothetical protein
MKLITDIEQLQIGKLYKIRLWSDYTPLCKLLCIVKLNEPCRYLQDIWPGDNSFHKILHKHNPYIHVFACIIDGKIVYPHLNIAGRNSGWITSGSIYEVDQET